MGFWELFGFVQGYYFQVVVFMFYWFLWVWVLDGFVLAGLWCLNILVGVAVFISVWGWICLLPLLLRCVVGFGVGWLDYIC